MSVIVLVFGQSGTGKSTSLRNFESGEIGVINVSGKPLPFRKKLPTISTNDYNIVKKALTESKAKSIVIDDATYLMTDAFMKSAHVKGYEKYNQMASDFADLIECARNLDDDKIVYFLGHTEIADDGREKFKTIGKMIDNYVTVEGKFTIVLKTVVKDGHYYFSTHNSGMDTVKSPYDMFEEDLIDNDLKYVDQTIREYYEMGEHND